MNLRGTEWSELSALYFINRYIWLCLHSIIYKYRPVSTKHGQNIYVTVQQYLNEFDHGSNWTRTTGVICSWIGKYCCIRLCLLSNIYKYKPMAPILVTMNMSIRSQMSLIMSQVIPDQSVLSTLEIENWTSVVYLVFIFIVNLYWLVLRWAI